MLVSDFTAGYFSELKDLGVNDADFFSVKYEQESIKKSLSQYLLEYFAKETNFQSFITKYKVLNGNDSDLTKYTLVKYLTSFVGHTFNDLDLYTKGHCFRTGIYARYIGKELGISAQDVNRVELAGYLHDLGKAFISQKILHKPVSLSDEEFAIIKTHPNIGIKNLELFEVFKDLLPAIKYHHEKYDGGGYNKLKGLDIHQDARILAVADAVDAMSTNRDYQVKKPKEEILVELDRNKDKQFDRGLVIITTSLLTDSEHTKNLRNEINMSYLRHRLVHLHSSNKKIEKPDKALSVNK